MDKGNIKTINLRMIDDSIGVMPPKYGDLDVFYACSTNKKRNWIGRFGMEESVICMHENYDYILHEHWKDRNSVTSGKWFKIYPEKCSAEMNWKVNKN